MSPFARGFDNQRLSWEVKESVLALTLPSLSPEKEKRITPIIVYPTQKTTSAALGKADSKHYFWKHLIKQKLEQVIL